MSYNRESVSVKCFVVFWFCNTELDGKTLSYTWINTLHYLAWITHDSWCRQSDIIFGFICVKDKRGNYHIPFTTQTPLGQGIGHILVLDPASLFCALEAVTFYSAELFSCEYLGLFKDTEIWHYDPLLFHSLNFCASWQRALNAMLLEIHWKITSYRWVLWCKHWNTLQ
jgi:hypothetical protein